MTTRPWVLEVGQSANDYIQKNGLDPARDIDRQPGGINYYDKRWPQKDGQVRLEHGRFSLVLPGVLWLRANERKTAPNEGLAKFSLHARLGPGGDIAHDQAAQAFMQVLEAFSGAGWRRFIQYSRPRLAGRQSFAYIQRDKLYGPDPTYRPSLHEWMSLGSSHTWRFHAEGQFVELSFRRDTQRMDETRLGGYLLVVSVFGEAYHGRSQFMGERRNRWPSLWDEEMDAQAARREQVERELVGEGFTLDVAYRDPRLRPEDFTP